MITITKTINDRVDPKDYEIRESGRWAEVYAESNAIDAKTTLCEINVKNGTVANIDILEGRQLTISEILESVKTIDLALKDLGFSGFLERRDREDRIEKLEQEAEFGHNE